MSHGTFTLSDTNPNDTTGGGGCICAEEKSADTRGPYVVAQATSTDSSVSPHVVVCAECVNEMNRLFGNGDVLRLADTTDQPQVSNPYAGDADQGDEVLQQRRLRAENLSSDAASLGDVSSDDVPDQNVNDTNEAPSPGLDPDQGAAPGTVTQGDVVSHSGPDTDYQWVDGPAPEHTDDGDAKPSI